VAGALALAQAQSPDALQVQAELTRQLQREHPGVLVYTEGDQVRLFARQATDIVNGDIQNATNTLRDQMSAIDRQIESIREEVNRRQIMLREQFARMERAISQMQSQGARLAAFAATLPRVGIAGM